MGSVLDVFLNTGSIRELKATVKESVTRLVRILFTLLLAILALQIALIVGVFYHPQPPPVVLSCPDGWVSHHGKCYYFSTAEGNWAYSQSICSSLGASLAGIDSLQELAFLMSYKRCDYPWIGLRREGGGQPWKWVNGTRFNNLFPVTGGADCAYLNDVGVSSSACLTAKNWICSKPSLHWRKR